ncbi:MAG: ArnT family glycosyltransferase [Elusimicrobiota bacterium]
MTQKSHLLPFSLFLILLLSLVVRFPMLHVPLERDEGGHAYAAWTWSEGGVPYRDAADNKPPLMFAIYRAAFALFGPTTEGIHIFAILTGLLQTWLMYVLAHRYLGQTGSLAAALSLSLLAAEPTIGVGNAANTETFMLLPILAAAYGLPRRPFLSGLCMGAAVMIKQTAVFEGAAFGLYLLWLLRREKKNLAPLLAYGAGCLVVPAFFAAYFWSLGAWKDFYFFVFLYNASYGSEVVRSGRTLEGLQNLVWSLKRLAPVEAGIWLAAAGGLGAAFFKDRRPHLPLVLLWGAASLAGVFAGFRFLSHYFVQAAPAVALAAGCGVHYAHARWGAGRRPWLIPALAASLLLLPYLYGNRFFFLGAPPEDISRRLYDSPNPFVEAVRVAQYVEENTAPGDTVYVFGSEPEILFYAKRRSATRYIYTYTLNGDFPKAEDLQKQAVAELEASRPELLLWVKVPFSHMATDRSKTILQNYCLQKMADGSHELEGLVFIEPGRPSRYFLGPDKVKHFKIEEVQAAQLLLYRRKE